MDCDRLSGRAFFLCVYVCSVIANQLSGLTVKICL